MMDGLGERLARGDQAAFSELYDACADQLHHFLVARLGSRNDADDVLQNTFVRLAGARGSLGRVENLKAYVFQVARNEATSFVRSTGRPMVETQTAATLFRDSADDHTARETAEIVAGALARLTADEREIVELKMYAKLTFREIADVVGVPQGTAATRYRSALERMREWCQRELS
jgi:RNA polymerase sigma-70 factor (ECF subfamily)